MQNFAKINKGATQAKAQSTAREIEEVRGLIDRAAQQEGQNPGGAVSLYNQASSMDRRLSGGVLGPFLSGKISALSQRAGGASRAAPADPARDGRADQLLQQARAVQQKDPNKARLLCRQVMRLYEKEPSNPRAQQAQRLLNTIKAVDEDEDP